jgi:hypothetical protein
MHGAAGYVLVTEAVTCLRDAVDAKVIIAVATVENAIGNSATGIAPAPPRRDAL